MERQSRVNFPALYQEMDRQRLDALIAVSPENFLYLTGAQILTQKIIPDRLAWCVLPRQGEPVIVVCGIEEELTRRDSWVKDIRTYVEFAETPVHSLVETLKDIGLTNARLGIENHYLAVDFWEELNASLPGASFVRVDAIFDRTRAIKTAEEARILREIGRATEKAVMDAFSHARPGDTEKKVADDITMGILGAGATSFFLVLSTAENTIVSHHYAGSRTLDVGEHVRVDGGGIWPHGYQSDLARMACVGKPSPQQRSVYQRLRDVERQTIAAARPGVRACNLFHICKNAAEKAGLPFGMPHIGHSLGIGLHEYPMLEPGNEAAILPGMILNIEPSVKVGGRGYHIEDLIQVTEGEAIILTDYSNTEEMFVI